jgi:hypothetical protein
MPKPKKFYRVTVTWRSLPLPNKEEAEKVKRIEG